MCRGDVCQEMETQCTAGTEYFHVFARIEYSHFFVGTSCVEVM